MDFLYIFCMHLHKLAPKFAIHCSALAFPLTKLKLHLSVTTNTQWFAPHFFLFSPQNTYTWLISMQNYTKLWLLHFICELTQFFGNRWSIFTQKFVFFARFTILSRFLWKFISKGLSQIVLDAFILYNWIHYKVQTNV